MKELDFENIEIVEAYEVKEENGKYKHHWSLHVYIPDFGMDYRGIKVIKKNRWLFLYPERKVLDLETQEFVRFPILSFSNRDTYKRLCKAIEKKGAEYLDKKLIEENKKGDE